MIETDRLLLRRWTSRDVVPFHAMGQDVDVMRYLGPPMSLEDCVATVARMNAVQDDHGHCFWAVERRADAAFIGFCGLKPGAKGTPIADDIEIGWRLARDTWGQGYALEAARASLDWGWANTPVNHISAITVQDNVRSWGLMERLGMMRVTDGDFDHPAVADGDPLKRHLTYRATRPA